MINSELQCLLGKNYCYDPAQGGHEEGRWALIYLFLECINCEGGRTCHLESFLDLCCNDFLNSFGVRIGGVSVNYGVGLTD